MSDRKVIFEAVSGSHLYGTNLPTSDHDYKGVFLPSLEDILSLTKGPEELSLGVKKSTTAKNMAGDVDRKHFLLQKFIKHALQGQPWALEMLFAPKDMITQSSKEWERIIDNRQSFLSRNSVAGFVGFALSQAYKATIKGDNLNLIRKLIELCDTHFRPAVTPISAMIMDSDETHYYLGENEIPVDLVTADDGTLVLEVAGRKFNEGLSIQRFRHSLVKLEEKYGTRSEASAKSGYDYKSLYHAYRLIFEARELLTTGVITLPRPEAAFLLDVRNGIYDADHHSDLKRHVEEIQNVVAPNSILPEQPDFKTLNDMHVFMMLHHLVLKPFR